jgi:hypothetical protein
MTEPHPHDHGIQLGAAPTAPAAAFPHEEWLELQLSDLGSAKVVVGLMAGIFITGLLLYFSIALICWQATW